MPVLLLPHKAAVTCKDWEACKWVVWVATAETSIQHKPTQALLEAAPLLPDTEQDSREVSYSVFLTWAMSPNAQKIFRDKRRKY